MSDEAFFRREGDRFIPQMPCRGFWGGESMSGRAVVGLLGAEIERRHGSAELVPARLSVDLFRLARLKPVEVSTSVIRDGGRLRLVEATLLIDGVEHARAQCQMLRPTGTPPGRYWPPAEPWQAPPPDALIAEPDPERLRRSEWRVISGGIGTWGPREVWLREYHEVVEGVPLTAFSRVALSADFASPWVHASDRGLPYMNTDVILQLHRLPRGEWVGFQSLGHEATDGIAVGACRVYDEDGPIGRIGVTALNNRMGKG
jgi:hypothetical protein